MPKHSKIETQEFSDNHFTIFNIDALISKRDVILTELKKYGIQDIYISKNLCSTTTLCFQIDIISTTDEQVNQFRNFIRETLKYESEIILLNRKTLAELLNFQIEEQQREFRSVLNSAIPLMELRSDDPLEEQLEEEWSEFSNIISNSSLSDEKKIALLEPLLQPDINLIYLKGALSALHLATQNSGIKMADWLLQKCPDLLWSGILDRGGNVLFFAAMNSNVELFDYFLSHDENQVLLKHKNFDDATLLHYAAMGTRIDILEKTIQLLKLDNINIPDNQGCYSIHYACRNASNAEVIKYLLKHGAQLDSITFEGKQPIHFLSYFYSFKIPQKFSTISLLEKFINNQTTPQNETILHLILIDLINDKKNVQDQNKINQYLKLIEVLIDNGLNPFIMNAKNETALKTIFNRMFTDVADCNLAYNLLNIFVKNGIIVENQYFVNELAYMKSPSIHFFDLERHHLKKLFMLLIDFFPHFYCHAILSKGEYGDYRNHNTVNDTMVWKSPPIKNIIEKIFIINIGKLFNSIPDEIIKSCEILLNYGFLINLDLSNEELWILRCIQSSFKKHFLAVGTKYYLDPLGGGQSVKGQLDKAICSSADGLKIQNFRAWELQLKIISRILVHKLHFRIEDRHFQELKLLLFATLRLYKMSIKVCYEITQFLLDHPESFAAAHFSKEEIKQLEIIRINSYRQLFEFPKLTFFAVNKLLSTNQCYPLREEHDKKSMKSNLDVIGQSVPRVKENKQRILRMFDEENTLQCGYF